MQTAFRNINEIMDLSKELSEHEASTVTGSYRWNMLVCEFFLF